MSMTAQITIDWTAVRLVVFDVDGTLYDQAKLRIRMIASLLGNCLRHPSEYKLIRVISTYRHCREQLGEEESADVGRLQYEHPAAVLGLSAETVQRMVDPWIHKRSLPFLPQCRFPDVDRFISWLRQRGTTIAVLSDYPAGDKLEALGIRADIVVSGIDSEVDRLKPHPAGLEQILRVGQVEPTQALMIGDRDDRDGECARRLGVPYLLKVSKAAPDEHTFARYCDLIDS